MVTAKKLRAYADHILATFESLDALSGTGIPMSAKNAQSIDSSQTKLEADRAHDPNGLGEPSRHGSELRERVVTGETLKFLTRWQDQSPHESRLILAPFGFGKSGQLVLFARQLALDMQGALVANEGNSEDSKLRIPVPIRLRSLNRDDIKKPQDSIGWLDFLVDSQFRIGSSSDDQLFTRDELATLFKGGHIVCLYDGFDELANGNFGPGSVLQRINDFHGRKVGYLLSSREPVLGFMPNNTFCLEPLSSDAVKKLLDESLSVGSPHRHRAAMARYHQLEPSIADLVRRPLFLAAWVDAVQTSQRADLSDLPDSIPALMERVTLHCFSRAQATMPELGGSPEVLRRKLPALGWILFPDAEKQFDGTPRTIEQRLAITHSCFDASLRPADVEDQQALALAHSLGFLYSNGAGRYFAQKIPVVEFLVGRFLAGLVAGSDDQKRTFVQLIRKWCYRPLTHDLLDFCWLVASEIKGCEVEPMIQGLIDWMCTASQHEPYRARWNRRLTDGPIADCLVHPAARYALRTAGRTGIGDVNLILKTAFGTKLHHHDGRSFIPRAVPDQMHISIVKATAAMYTAADMKNKDAWAWEIETAAGRVTEGSAAGLVKTWIDCYAAAREEEDKRIWVSAIEAAAGQVPAGSAVGVIETLIDYHAMGTLPGAGAIEAAARRVPEELAVRVVQVLIDRYATLQKEIYGWETAIEAAAGRVPEGSAAALIQAWIARYATAPEAEKSAWARAIEGAAGRVSENSAPGTVRMLTDAYSTLLEDKSACERAIEEVANRVAEDSAAGLVKTWIECYATAREEESAALVRAIEGAAGRVRDGSAADLVQTLIDCYALARMEDQSAWKGAISAAAQRIPEGSAAGSVLTWMDHHATARGTEKNALAWAFTAAANRVAEGSAAGLVKTWIDRYATAREEEKNALAWAIMAAAGRVLEGSAAGVVQALIGRYGTARKEEKLAWKGAILAAARRVPEHSAANMIQTWINLYNTACEDDVYAWGWVIDEATWLLVSESATLIVFHALLSNGWIRRAVETAIRADSIALIAEIGDDGGKDGKPARKVWPEGRLIAVSRDDPRLVLDRFEAVVPEGIIARLLGTGRPLASRDAEKAPGIKESASLAAMKSQLGQNELVSRLFKKGLEFAVGSYLGPQREEEFSESLESESDRSGKLRSIAKMLAKELGEDQQSNFYWFGSRKPRAQKRRLKAGATQANDKDSDGYLYVNGYLLTELLFSAEPGKAKRRAEAIHQKAIGNTTDDSDEKPLNEYAFVCKKCGAIHEIAFKDLKLSDDQIRPPVCGVCAHPLKVSRITYPEQFLECGNCKKAPLAEKRVFRFQAEPIETKGWGNGVRDAGNCPRRKCGNPLKEPASPRPE